MAFTTLFEFFWKAAPAGGQMLALPPDERGVQVKLDVKKGFTSKRVLLFIQNSASTTGAGLTGLTSSSPGLVCYRAREDDGAAGGTQLVLSAGTRGTWSSGGFVEKDATNMPGVYELGLDNAGLASGSNTVIYMLLGAANMAPIVIEIQLVDYDPQDIVRLGLTSLPNVVSGSAGALPTTGTGANQISVSSGQVILQAGTGTGQLDFTSGVVKANAVQWLGGTIPAVNVTGVPLIDVKYVLGTIVTAATAGILDVNTKNYNNVAAATDANNLPKVDVEDWKAGVVPAVTVTGVPKVDVADWLGTAVTAATAGIPDVNAKNINNVAATSVTTISANLGTTQPINFTGTGASALAKSDMVDIAGAAVSTSTAQIGVNMVNSGGVAQTAGDIYNAVSNIGVTSAALNQTAASATYTTGTDTGGVANTATADGVYDSVTDTAGTVDFYYEFTLAASGQTAVGVNWIGYVVGVVNTIKVYAYNWGASAWDQLGTIVGIAGVINGTEDWELTSAHTGTAGNAGKVRIRFNGTGLTASNTKTDRILLGYVNVVTVPANFSSLSIDASGRIDLGKILGSASVGAAGYVGVDWGQVTNKATSNALTGTTISTSQVIATVTNQLTAAQIATGLWQDTTTGDFTVASSIGKSLYTSGAIPGAAGGLFIAGSNAATTVNFTGNLSGSVGSVTGAVGSVTAAVTLSAGDSPVVQTGTATAGGASTITIQTALGTDNLVNGCKIKITSGTGAKQERTITGYVNSTLVATVDRAWTTNPDATSVYAILYDDAPATNSSLQVVSSSVQGNVTGSVASVTGAVGSVTAGVTVTTNNDKTGYSLTVAPPTAAAIATTLWQDLTSSADFTTVGSIGKLLATFTFTGSNVNANAQVVADKTGYSLLSSGLDLCLVAGKTLLNAIKYIGAATSGKLPSGAGTGQENFQDFAGSAAVDITVDSSGNRTTIVYH